MSNNFAYFCCLIYMLVLTACSFEKPTVERPENVSLDAVSAIGPDGGAWVKCELSNSKEAQCELFFSSSGSIWTRGVYVLRIGDEFSELRSANHLTQLLSGFSLIDGHTIHLSDNKRLIPDGIIDSPFPDGRGKKTEYSRGVVVTPEQRYEN